MNTIYELLNFTNIVPFSNYNVYQVGYGETKGTILEWITPSTHYTLITNIKMGFENSNIFPNLSQNNNFKFDIKVNGNSILSSSQNLITGYNIFEKPYIDKNLFLPIKQVEARIIAEFFLSDQSTSPSWYNQTIQLYAEITGIYFSIREI